MRPDTSPLEPVDGSAPTEAIQFEATDTGLCVTDRIERRRRDLRTDVPVSPTEVSADLIQAPVRTAVSIDACTLGFGGVFGVNVWNEYGEMVSNDQGTVTDSFDAGEYLIQVSGPIALYVSVHRSVAITTDVETRIRIESDADVVLGARSLHERPSTTVTTTERPTDLMAAVSTFGSAIKTLSPERSWPTLRGHPPAVEVGDRLSIPDGLAPPATDVRIEVPRAIHPIYTVAPLSYYLGCPVVPGDRPRIVAGDGVIAALDEPDLERAVERTLKQVVFLDCLVRTEGLYRFPQHERAELEPRLDLDFADLYDRPQAHRIGRYLDVPYETLAPYFPEWEVVAYVDPTGEQARLLPYLVNDLAILKSPRGVNVDTVDRSTLTDGSEPDDATATEHDTAIADFKRGDTDAAGGSGPDRTLVEVPDEALETVWAGSEVPVGGNKAILAAFENDLDRSLDDGPIDVRVVCNDPEMAEEFDAATGIYGTESDFPFDVTTYRGLSTGGLELLLEEGVDFLHYIGHAEERGLRCRNGWVDVAELDSVAVDAFLLNACRSYEQGVTLVEQGAIGGVVTVGDVPNTGAVAFGRAMAQLLNDGYTIRAALDVVRRLQATSTEYISIGNGGHAIAQWQSPVLELVYLRQSGDDRYGYDVRTYPASTFGIGATYSPYLDGTGDFLANKRTSEFVVDGDTLTEMLGQGHFPVVVDGALRWSSNVRPEEL